MSDWQELIDLAMRRPLTHAEKEALERHLTAHPEARAAWQEEMRLNTALARIPKIEPATNFTALVLEEIHRSNSAHRVLARKWWLPKLAFAGIILGTGTLFYHQHQLIERQEVAQTLVAVSDVATIFNAQTKPQPEMAANGPALAVLQDFDAIRSLGRVQVDLDLSLLKALE